MYIFSRKAALVASGVAVVLIAGYFLAGKSEPPRQPAPLPIAGKLRLDGVTVVDTATGALTPAMSILMDHGQIISVTQTANTPADSKVETIDATGRFVVPGYNNMHSHALTAANASGALAIMLTDGVTGFRQMDGSAELLQQRRDNTLPLGTDAPALLVTPGSLLMPFNVPSVADVAAEVRRQKAEGADFIKVALVSPDVFFAAITEAKRVGLPALGHLQEGVDPAAASRAGYRSIEHLGPGDTMWIGCSTQQQALLAEAAAHPLMPTPPFKIPAFVQRLFAGMIQKILINPAASETPDQTDRMQRALDSFSREKCEALAALFVANDTWQVPTLVRLRTQYLADQPEYQHDPSLPFIPTAALKDWQDVTDKFHKLPPTMLATFRDTYQHDLMLTRLFADAGVPMMTGTDTGGQLPGQSLLQEFDELAKAGLTPLKILQMTTIDPAKFLGRTATMGKIAAGQNADLVLLEANPVESVENMHRIAGVVRAGFYHSPQALMALRDRVAAGHGYLDPR